MKRKLDIVREELNRRAREQQDIVVIEEPDTVGQFNLPDTYHSVSFKVAPVVGLYEADQLQDFMMSLVPSLKPDNVHPFHYKDIPDAGTFLVFGRLYFKEEIAKIRTKRDIELTYEEDEELFIRFGFREGRRSTENTVTYGRPIGITVYPDGKILDETTNLQGIGRVDRYSHAITLEELKKFKLGYQPPMPAPQLGRLGRFIQRLRSR